MKNLKTMPEPDTYYFDFDVFLTLVNQKPV